LDALRLLDCYAYIYYIWVSRYIILIINRWSGGVDIFSVFNFKI